MSGFKLQRLGMVMEPEPENPQEIEGVLNPAAARGPDGELYLFPRLVARGNYSRIGIARVRFNEAGDPAGVERLGVALEPEADYERRPDDSGGCEDPRITFVEPLRRYMMTYTAFSPQGPRIALAVSEDLFPGFEQYRPQIAIRMAPRKNPYSTRQMMRELAQCEILLFLYFEFASTKRERRCISFPEPRNMLRTKAASFTFQTLFRSFRPFFQLCRRCVRLCLQPLSQDCS
jgi:hypothetical protein